MLTQNFRFDYLAKSDILLLSHSHVRAKLRLNLSHKLNFIKAIKFYHTPTVN